MNFKTFLMLFSFMYNLHTFSEFFYCCGKLWRHITWLIYKKKWQLCFFSTLLCKEKESTKHLLVTSLIARKTSRTHTTRFENYRSTNSLKKYKNINNQFRFAKPLNGYFSFYNGMILKNIFSGKCWKIKCNQNTIPSNTNDKK